MKKFLSAILLFVAILSWASIPALADSGQWVSMSFNSYPNANGSCDGSANGKYYYLTPGNCYLQATEVYGKGAVYITLKRDIWGINPEYGTRTVEWPGNYLYSGLDVSSGSYYLFAWAYPGISYPNTQYSIYGYMHDHTP